GILFLGLLVAVLARPLLKKNNTTSTAGSTEVAEGTTQPQPEPTTTVTLEPPETDAAAVTPAAPLPAAAAATAPTPRPAPPPAAADAAKPAEPAADVSQPRSFTGHSSGVQGIAIAPDGQSFVTVGTDKAVILWKLSEPRPARLHNLE